MSTVTESCCQHCGTEVEQPPHGGHRKWCSERCRKAGQVIKRHGTHASYVMGCRCDACQEAHRDASRKAGWNLRRGARGEKKRQWDQENRKVCACGRRTGDSQTERCNVCARAEKRAGRDLRRQMIAELWGEGASLKGIADALGTTPRTVGVEMARMRADGWALPYRHHRSAP